jgi:hypothetical protein
MINHGRAVLAERHEKKYRPGRRLPFAFVAVLVTLTMYAWIGLQVAEGKAYKEKPINLDAPYSGANPFETADGVRTAE